MMQTGLGSSNKSKKKPNHQRREIIISESEQVSSDWDELIFAVHAEFPSTEPSHGNNARDAD